MIVDQKTYKKNNTRIVPQQYTEAFLIKFYKKYIFNFFFMGFQRRLLKNPVRF